MLAKSTSAHAYSHPKPKPFVATGPNQIYTWAITYLPSNVRGMFLYLYMIIDIYSGKIVGWQVHNPESNEIASDLMVDICQGEKIKPNQVVLH